MARAVIQPRHAAIAILVLVLLRLTVAALLPLSGDEAYYWLWSRHLAAGYYDHPPAIAFLIRGGTILFGDTPLGVRLFPVLMSLPASWFVWRAARTLMEERRAALAALLFNLTLMIGVEALVATPDAPSIAASAAFIWCLAELRATNDRRWWLAAGVAAGLGLLSKFAALFLGAGTLFWLASDARVRHWLRSPWPYLGGALAALIFAPNLLWQAQHDWATFAFQFGRAGHGHLTLRFIGEFLAAQVGLATPLIFVLAAIGLWRASPQGSDSYFLASLVWTALAYFLFHALRDRVQGNWPCFLYPALAILAADAFRSEGGFVRRILSWAAAPLAALLLLLVYSQALWGWIPLKNDPLPRLLARGFTPVGEVVAQMVRAGIADAVLTSDYETTAWLRFYQPQLKVIQLNEAWRYPYAPAPGTLLNRKLVYLAESKRDQRDVLRNLFSQVAEMPTELRTQPKSGRLITYVLFLASGPKSSGFGRMP